jgi:hypothetical protein
MRGDGVDARRPALSLTHLQLSLRVFLQQVGGGGWEKEGMDDDTLRVKRLRIRGWVRHLGVQWMGTSATAESDEKFMETLCGPAFEARLVLQERAMGCMASRVGGHVRQFWGEGAQHLEPLACIERQPALHRRKAFHLRVLGVHLRVPLEGARRCKLYWFMHTFILPLRTSPHLHLFVPEPRRSCTFVGSSSTSS